MIVFAIAFGMSFDHRTKILNTTYNLHQALTLYLRDRGSGATRRNTSPDYNAPPATPCVTVRHRGHTLTFDCTETRLTFDCNTRITTALTAFLLSKGLSRVPVASGKKLFVVRRGSLESQGGESELFVVVGRGALSSPSRESELFESHLSAPHCRDPLLLLGRHQHHHRPSSCCSSAARAGAVMGAAAEPQSRSRRPVPLFEGHRPLWPFGRFGLGWLSRG